MNAKELTKKAFEMAEFVVTLRKSGMTKEEIRNEVLTSDLTAYTRDIVEQTIDEGCKFYDTFVFP